MKLNAPIIITPRLLPGVQIGDTFVSIEYGEWTQDGRQGYTYYIDPLGPEEGFSDLSSGVGGGSLQEGLESLLCFMSDAGDTYRYELTHDHDGDDDLFPPEIMEWCYQYEEEIGMLQYEVEATKKLIEEDA